MRKKKLKKYVFSVEYFVDDMGIPVKKTRKKSTYAYSQKSARAEVRQMLPDSLRGAMLIKE